MDAKRKPKLAVWKFASCDGCQLTLLDCEDHLLAIAGEMEIANFAEASRAIVKGPYDLSLVEGSITRPHDAERIHRIRRASKYLVTIGACATSGGIQALRNFKDVKEFTRIVYATPAYIETLNKSTPIADHVFVDFELRGCPINKRQLIEVISAFLHDRRVQAARDRLRDGRARNAMSRSGHARRLRRDLPGLQPRMLRLLRPEGNAEHCVDRCAV
jgi:sulfhydrogenase subunit delta